jgi:hypothetical protein
MVDSISDTINWGITTGVGLGVMKMTMKGMQNILPRVKRARRRRKR